MHAGSSTSPTKEFVPGLILLDRFLLDPALVRFRFTQSQPTSPPARRAAPIIPYFPRPACMPTESACGRGRALLTLSYWRNLIQEIRGLIPEAVDPVSPPEFPVRSLVRRPPASPALQPKNGPSRRSKRLRIHEGPKSVSGQRRPTTLNYGMIAATSFEYTLSVPLASTAVA